MPDRKKKFKEQFEKALLRRGQLVEMGYPEEKIIQTMMGEGFQSPVARAKTIRQTGIRQKKRFLHSFFMKLDSLMEKHNRS